MTLRTTGPLLRPMGYEGHAVVPTFFHCLTARAVPLIDPKMTLHWHTEPLLLFSLLFVGWAYAMWIGPLRLRHPSPAPVQRWRIICFYAGMVVIYLAVGSPIDQIGETYLFSVHMFQHLLLMYVAPILIVLGIPPARFDETLENHPWLRRPLRWYLNPVLAAVLFTLILSLWHVPALYESALRDKTIHIIEHATIMFFAFALFWFALSLSKTFPALQPGLRMLLIFVLMVGQTPLFGVLSFSDQVLYPTYEWAPRITSLSALEDQILGGVLMKVGGMLFALPFFGMAFFSWAKSQEKNDA
jgi:putative membrane protein